MPLDLDSIDAMIEEVVKPKPGVSFARPGQPPAASATNPSPKPISFMGPRPTPQDVPQSEQPFGAGPSGGGVSFAQPQPSKPSGNPADPSVKGAPSVSFAKRYEDAQNKVTEAETDKGPQLTGWKKWLDIAGRLTLPGVEKAIPGTPGHFSSVDRPRNIEAAKSAAQGIDRQASIADRESEAGLRDAKAKAAGQKDDEVLAKSGLRRDEQGSIVPMPDDQLPPEIRTRMANEQSLSELRESQQALAQAKLEVEKAKNDPNSPQFKLAQQKLAVEQQRTQQALAALGLHQAEFANKLSEQDLVKPSGQSQSRGSAAQAVLQLMPDLERNVRANAREMGPLMGRINRGEIAIGNVSPDVANLYSAMKSFYALQPAVHGFRNAEFVKDFETALGTLERDPEAFIAGMRGLKPTLESVANEGKTFHRRIVEQKPGTPASSGGNSAPPQPAGATHTGVGSADKKKHWLDANGKDLGLAE